MRLNRRSWVSWFPILFCVGMVVGCGRGGRDTVSVTGTVTLDGDPVADAAVMFAGPEGGQPVTTTTDASGRFSLEAVPGTNSVAVSKSKTAGAAEGAAPAGEDEGMPEDEEATETKVEWLVPMRYANYRTSDLKVDVKEGMEPVKLELTSAE